MELPDHLRKFRCMEPWVGPKYCKSEHRLAIVCESHYIPDNATELNKDPGCQWYESCQEDLPRTVLDQGSVVNLLDYINTRHCVQNLQNSGNRTYKRINKFLSFRDIAFFNYIFRPVDRSARGYSSPRFNIGDKDKEVGASIMRWFIQKHKPKNIVIASSIILAWSCVGVVLLDYPKIRTCNTHHPRTGRFSVDIDAFLEEIGYRRNCHG